MRKIRPALENELAACRRAHESGEDSDALLHAIYVCTSFGFALPDWVIRGFRDAYQKGLRGELKSWDDVFGHPRTKKRRANQERDFVMPQKVWTMVTEAKANGEPIDDLLFERVGDELGMKKTMVKDYYRIWRDIEGSDSTPKKED